MEQVRKSNSIAILMATYNGERYIKEQLDSVARQTHRDWHLYIHDDGSTDQTPAIIHTFARQHPNVTILDYESQKGAKDNFLSMLQRVEADHYIFADQDDVWHEQKVELSWKAMQQLESEHPGLPLIVHTDLYVTDASLNIVKESFWEASNIHPSLLTRFHDLAATTPATGSAMLFNHKAKEATIIPAPLATMHDAWVTACVLSQGGLIHSIPQPLVYYRQHESNVLGASDASRITWGYRLRHFKEMQRQNRVHYKMLQALGYGSIARYYFHKVKYKIGTRRLSHNTTQH